jgi:hypothetical protein
MNKLREQFRQRLLGQLSDDKTEVDLNNAVDVCKDFNLSFISFLRENYSTQNRLRRSDLKEDMWRLINTDSEYTTEELYNKFLEIYDK